MEKLMFIVFCFLLFLGSCVAPTQRRESMPRSSGGESVATKEVPNKQRRIGTGLFIDQVLKSKVSVGGSDQAFLHLGAEDYEWTYNFRIGIQCGLPDEVFISPPLTYRSVQWKLSPQWFGEGQSDHEGVIEFAVRTKEATSFDKIEIEYKGERFALPISTGPMVLKIPKDLCVASKK